MKSKIDRYTFRIEWSEEDKCHVARCLEFPSLGAHGRTAEDALREIKLVVAESIKWLMEENEPVPVPFGVRKFRGHLTVRIPPEKHRELAIRSADEGVSINQLITSLL